MKSTNNRVIDNNFNGGASGISLLSNSKGNSITNNILSGYSGSAIRFADSLTNYIYNNSLSYSSNGINFENMNSTGNLISYNRIVQNTNGITYNNNQENFIRVNSIISNRVGLNIIHLGGMQLSIINNNIYDNTLYNITNAGNVVGVGILTNWYGTTVSTNINVPISP